MTMNDSTLQTIAEHIKDSEGRGSNYPYLDIKGKITAGIGFLADNEASFVALPFKIGGRDATDAEKRAVYRQMLEIRDSLDGDYNKKARHYEKKTPLRLNEVYMIDRLNQEIWKRSAKIQNDIGTDAWNRLDDRGKTVIIDIHYANGGLDGFPDLKTAAANGKLDDMARESLFFADSKTGVRDNGRLLRNYALLKGRDVDDPNLIAEFEALRDAANARWWRDQMVEARKKGDAERIEFLQGHEYRNLPNVETSDVGDDETMQSEDEAETDADNRGEAEILGHADDDDFTSVKSFLQSPGDDEDEALLKDDLTEDEVKRVMMSNAYNDSRDPRFKALNNRIAWWFEDRWGDGDAKVDATGRMIQAERPETPAPTRPLAANVAEIGVDLGREIGRVIDAAFGKVNPRTVTPARLVPAKAGSGVQGAGRLDSRVRGNDEDGGTVSPVITLQKTLNLDDVRHGGMVLDDPLKPDGVAGPKTRRALRHAVASLGADGLLARLSPGEP